MMRKLAVIVAVTLTLTACVTEPFGDAEGKRVKAAVEGLFGELERGEYTTAASHWCTYEPPASPPTASRLEADFAGFPRPWTTKLTSAQYTHGGTGIVNLTLTDGAGVEHPHNVDITMAGGAPKLCGVDTGTIQIDVDH